MLFGLVDRRAKGLAVPIPAGVSLDLLLPMDVELQMVDGTLLCLFWQTLCAGQDGAYSLCLLDVFNALRQAHIECLWEQEGHRATEQRYTTVRHLRQRLPHIIQQEHKWGQRPTEACCEGGVSHSILPEKVGDRGSVEYPKKDMGTSFISDLAENKKIKNGVPLPSPIFLGDLEISHH